MDLLFNMDSFARSRSFYCALAGAENQLFAFVATKTYYDFERLLSLPGVIFFYGAIGVIGFVLFTSLLFLYLH